MRLGVGLRQWRGPCRPCRRKRHSLGLERCMRLGVGPRQWRGPCRPCRRGRHSQGLERCKRLGVGLRQWSGPCRPCRSKRHSQGLERCMRLGVGLRQWRGPCRPCRRKRHSQGLERCLGLRAVLDVVAVVAEWKSSGGIDCRWWLDPVQLPLQLGDALLCLRKHSLLYGGLRHSSRIAACLAGRCCIAPS